MVRGGSFRRELTVPYNGKIADITEADTTKHELDLAVALTETRQIVSIIFGPERITGTGHMKLYANEGAVASATPTYREGVPFTVIAAGTNRIQYSLSVKNDDFDCYCFGYVVIIG